MNTLLRTEKSKVLIPAAGFGKRSKTEDGKSKELLIHPVSGMPMIRHTTEIAQKLDCDCHIILRKEKTDLRDYLENLDFSKNNLKIQVIESSIEWPETLLLSEKYWAESNLILLPDLIWENSDVGFRMLNHVNSGDSELVFAGKTVSDPENWGIVNLFNQDVIFCEKPRSFVSHPWAWGLIAFKRSRGRELLEKLLKSSQDHEWQSLSGVAELFDLQQMRDETR